MIDWRMLSDLRHAAIRDGLDGCVDSLSVWDLCVAVVELAAEGLGANDEWMLAYPLNVLRARQNGADRALNLYSWAAGTAEQRMRWLCQRRQAVPPSHLRRDVS